MAKYIGAVDQGTTSTRFMIFDQRGRILGLDLGRFTVPPDTAIPVILLVNPKGVIHSVSGPDPQGIGPEENAATQMGRFHALYRELLRIEAMTGQGTGSHGMK